MAAADQAEVEEGEVGVKVLLFAGLREQRGRSEEAVLVARGTTARQLYERLFPTGPGGRMPVLFAIDQEWVDGSAPLVAGQEIAFIPPLGGG